MSVASLQKPVIRLNTKLPVDQRREYWGWATGDLHASSTAVRNSVILVIPAIYTTTKWVLYSAADVLTPKYDISSGVGCGDELYSVVPFGVIDGCSIYGSVAWFASLSWFSWLSKLALKWCN